MISTPPPRLAPDPAPGFTRPVSIDPRPYSLVVPGFLPDGTRSGRFRIVIGKPSGYAPGGVSYYPRGTR